MTIFYFDFLSPYSYIASQLIQTKFTDIEFDYRPVVLGTILSKRGVAGPGEIPARRRIGLEDALLLAQHYGFSFEGPPTHPFNSIYALRSVCAVENASLRKKLVHRYFDLAWKEGKSLEDLEHLRACLRELEIEHDPEDVATRREYRSMLKSYTKDALNTGVWGVPSFVADDLVFFGHDRLELLQSYLRGKIHKQPEKLQELLNRPQPGRIK